MVFEKDEFLIHSRSKRLLKAYLSFIIIDIIAILFLNNIFVDFDIYAYTFIRSVCISFSIAIYSFKQAVVLFKKLSIERKGLLCKLDTNDCDMNDTIDGGQWGSIKNKAKIMMAGFEVNILFGAQAIAITYFRERFYSESGLSIIIGLILMGTLTYLSRSYMNKKYCF